MTTSHTCCTSSRHSLGLALYPTISPKQITVSACGCISANTASRASRLACKSEMIAYFMPHPSSVNLRGVAERPPPCGTQRPVPARGVLHEICARIWLVYRGLRPTRPPSPYYRMPPGLRLATASGVLLHGADELSRRHAHQPAGAHATRYPLELRPAAIRHHCPDCSFHNTRSNYHATRMSGMAALLVSGPPHAVASQAGRARHRVLRRLLPGSPSPLPARSVAPPLPGTVLLQHTA